MNTIISLQNKAITAAKAADWSTANQFNAEILDLEPHNIGALNRQAICALQLGDLDQARANYRLVLDLEPSNPIASKKLKELENKKSVAEVNITPKFSTQQFIEEPSKSKIISLHRLAGKNILEKLHTGQELALKTKNRYISVETTDKVYLGSLPEDISLRLAKLIASGNQYSCQIHSFSHNSCKVFIKEIFRSEANQDKLSFPVNKNSLDNGDLEDEFFIENNIPMDIVEIDNDVEGEEKSLSDLSNEDSD